MPDQPFSRRFDPVDIVQLELLATLPPGHRVQVMLDAQAFIRGVIRGRLQRQYPEATEQEVSMLLLEELERAKERDSRPQLIRPHPADP
jgi:hypothetical protein